MGNAEKNSRKLEILKWFFIVPSMLMFWGTQNALGKTYAFILCVVFGLIFYLLCSRGRMMIICEDIVKDMKEALNIVGQKENVFEVKSLNLGLIVRVYLIRARGLAPECNKAVLDKISKGWYKHLVWVTQVVDVEDESDVKKAQRALNAALLEDIRERENDDKSKFGK